jgi:hypothetical protein
VYSLHTRYTHSEVELRKCCLGQSAKSKIPYHLIICDTVCLWLVTGLWFSLGTLVSFTKNTDRHDINEILLKVAFNTIKPTNLYNLYVYLIWGQFCWQKNESSWRKSLNTRDQQNLSHKVHVQRSPNCQTWPAKSGQILLILLRTDTSRQEWYFAIEN